jgi:hypothetical protein
LVDLNGDGHKDILSGSYSRMDREMAGLFQVLWGQPGGGFKPAAVLNGTDSKPLIIPIKDKNKDQLENICTRPYAVDWNGDGHLDLVVGNFGGSFYVFKGEGKGKFHPVPEQLMVGNQPLKIAGHHSDPFVIDWDGDGDLDLLSGSTNGGVQWAENTAGKGKPPVLKAFRYLIPPGKNVAYGALLRLDELKGPTTATRIWVDDVNGDGKLDILVGDNVTLASPAKGLSKAEYEKRLAKWQKEVNKVTAIFSNTKATQKEREEANRRFSKLYAERRQFVIEERTGFVWLYLQK